MQADKHNSGIQLDFFEALGVQAESIVSRLAKARFRAEYGGRYSLIAERLGKEGRHGLGTTAPQPSRARDIAHGELIEAVRRL